MKTVQLTINGKRVEAEEGTTLLAAARSAGIDIPTLCHHPAVQAYGACRMCLVDIARGGREKTVASCIYTVEQDLVVTTSTPKLERMRKLIVELLHPAYTPPEHHLRVPRPRFFGSLPDCSLCGLCVRYCRDVVKRNALYFAGRGVDRRVAFVPGAASECDDCRACFDLCSSGWIVSRYASEAAAQWDERPMLRGLQAAAPERPESC